jgi:amino acid permease
MSLGVQVVWLFVLALPIACIAWTVTHEEVFREPRQYAVDQSEHARNLWRRKFFYLFTCEYCFAHYVTAFFLIITQYKLLYDDWRGYLISFFSLPFVSNVYIGLYAQTKLEAKKDRMESRILEHEAAIKKIEKEHKEHEEHDRKFHAA